MFYKLNIEKMLEKENVTSISKMFTEIENDYGEVLEAFNTLCVVFNNGKFLLYDNERELLKVGKKHWWGISMTYLDGDRQNDYFTDKELKEIHK